MSRQGHFDNSQRFQRWVREAGKLSPERDG
jgi:hypothetical protein